MRDFLSRFSKWKRDIWFCWFPRARFNLSQCHVFLELHTRTRELLLVHMYYGLYAHARTWVCSWKKTWHRDKRSESVDFQRIFMSRFVFLFCDMECMIRMRALISNDFLCHKNFVTRKVSRPKHGFSPWLCTVISVGLYYFFFSNMSRGIQGQERFDRPGGELWYWNR